METRSAAAAMRTVEESAEKSNVAERRDVRKLLELPGDWVRQGDVNLLRVPADWPRGKKRGDRQVAVGTTTGSRHVATGDAVEVYERSPDVSDLLERIGALSKDHARTAAALRDYQLGPVCVASDDWTLAHPEHAHDLCPAGTIQVLYQRDPRQDAAVAD